MGASGSGKSSLAIQLVGLGGRLVSDDQTILSFENEQLLATRPESLPAVVECRGVGLLHGPLAERSVIKLAVSLDEVEVDRLPPLRNLTLLGIDVPLIYSTNRLDFASAIMMMMRYGRSVP